MQLRAKPALQIGPVQVGEEGGHGRMLGEPPGNPSSSRYSKWLEADLTLKVMQGLVGIVSSVIGPAHRRNLNSASQPSVHPSRRWEKPKARTDEELGPKI